ncbi:MAG: cytochrome c [Candidatus Eisenbacteria bacterium]|nr:cytochrome c [Candidatus Eisenbacteria bacterium]
MLKPALLLGVLALWSVSFQQGCQDLKKSLTHLRYYPIRDMRQTIVIDPQRYDPTNGKWVTFRAPDSLAVSSIGQDRWIGSAPYDETAPLIHDPTPVTDESIVRGDTLFRAICSPCHGKTMMGDGTVVPFFMPPPDLLAQATRDRSDGFIYSYMRYGGVVMPSYGNALSAHDAWDILHYLRHMQKVSPR